ncbi:cobalamin biosynthesis protein [Actinomadura sp. WMMB 499]|uniref:cobalamin biosynthesis protein n=1 Tax=Actinomadura sp. WMMB 499 TaxID=1219491 RepID=UPI00159DF9E8|nr:cobalamin biosynthesis protein [Actinomadura sp. WMMB 499]
MTRAAVPVAVIGAGASTRAGAAEVGALLDAVLREAGVRAGAVWCVATADGRGGEPAVRAAARDRGLPLVAYPVPVLARIEVPHPSDAVRSRTGTASVAEAAALHAVRAFGGAPARLAVPKRASGYATAALATGAVEGDAEQDEGDTFRHNGAEGVKPWYLLPERDAPGDGDSEDCP